MSKKVIEYGSRSTCENCGSEKWSKQDHVCLTSTGGVTVTNMTFTVNGE